MSSVWPFLILFLLFSLFCLGLLLFVRLLFRELGVDGALRRVRRVPIEQVKDGQIVKTVGRLAHIGTSLTAPLSGRPCVYYELTVQRRMGRGKASRWVPIAREERWQDFLLQDETGRALVRVDSPTIISCSQKQPTLGEGPKLRYQERRLEAGEVVAVMGRGTWERELQSGMGFGGYREPPRFLVVRPALPVPLHISDDISSCR